MERAKVCAWCKSPKKDPSLEEWAPHGICPQCVAQGIPEAMRGRRQHPTPVQLITKGEAVTLVCMILVIIGFVLTVVRQELWP